MNSMVGERIKKRRKVLRLSVEDICSRIGVSRATWYRYENGEIEKISAQKMSLIAKVLQTSVSELLGIENDFSSIKAIPNPQAKSTLTDADLAKIASVVQVNSEAPRTVEARIVSFGMDRLPQEDRERLLAMIRAMYANRPDLFDNKKGEDNEG